MIVDLLASPAVAGFSVSKTRGQGPCFTAPTFPTFVGLVVGLIAQTRRRTVCGMLTGAGLDRVWHHSRAHRLFANARWSSDALGLVWPI